MKHLEGLNQTQREAAQHIHGPLLIVAGAGTGKTRTLTHRIIHLIQEGVDPRTILAITFTNKAAKEMLERVESLIEKHNTGISLATEKPFISTFHALGVHILKRHGDKMRIPRHFSILDKSDSSVLIKEALKLAGVDPKQFTPDRVSHTISRQKGNLITAEEYAQRTGNQYFPTVISSIWKHYETLLEKHKAVDFDDLILKPVLLLKNNTDIKDYYQEKWKYIHIDEYQDTNEAQYALSKMLAEKYKNICVVGDSDQNIYGWRGANIKNILNFEDDYPDARVVLLEENYRSTQTILLAANDVIKKNELRKEKNLFTKNEDGEKISLYEAYDENDEARFVAQKTRELIKNGVEPEHIAVLYRANFQSRVLEEQFLSFNIPYQVLGVRFFERKEIKDILSFVRAGLNPDSLADIKRIINVPPRGIGKVTLAKMFANQEGSLTPAIKKRVDGFRLLLANIGRQAKEEAPSRLLKYVIKETGIEDHLKRGNEEDKERLENIYELVSLATKYDIFTPEEGIEKLLSDAALATDQDNLEKRTNAVKLMTVHAAKGLEFPYVFITGMEQDLFPHKKFGDANQENEEEERRLFYVALTRAEKKLFLSYTSLRTIFGSKQVNIPSEFLLDIDENILEKEERCLLEDTIYID